MHSVFWPRRKRAEGSLSWNSGISPVRAMLVCPLCGGLAVQGEDRARWHNCVKSGDGASIALEECDKAE